MAMASSPLMPYLSCGSRAGERERERDEEEEAAVKEGEVTRSLEKKYQLDILSRYPPLR